MRSAHTASVVTLALGILACGGGGGGGGGGDGDVDGDAGQDPSDAGHIPLDAGPADPIFGEPPNLVRVAEVDQRDRAEPARSSANADFVTDGETVLVETMREGNCRLLESDVSYCGDCTNGFCVDDECRPWPTLRDAGRIRLSGLTIPITLSWNQVRYFADQKLPPADLFRDGAAITASAPGDDLGAFTVSAYGVAPIDPVLVGECRGGLIPSEEGDTVLTWPTPEPGARVRLWMPSRNNGHGLPPNLAIECEGRDTGELVIPGAFLERFPRIDADYCKAIVCAGVDCPPATLSRYTQGEAAAGEETVALRVESQATFYVVAPE